MQTFFTKRMQLICRRMLFFIYQIIKCLKRIIKRKYRLRKEEMCIIGDQLVTDIRGGNSYDVLTILVDPLAKEEFI